VQNQGQCLHSKRSKRARLWAECLYF